MNDKKGILYSRFYFGKKYWLCNVIIDTYCYRRNMDGCYHSYYIGV